MTVIVFFEDLGVAVSDVLLSVDGSGGGIELPSVGNPRSIDPPLPITPTKLVRKFFRVSRPGSDGMFLTCGTVSHIHKLAKMVARIIAGSVNVPPTLVSRLNRNSVASVVDLAATLVEQAGSPEFELLGMVDSTRYARHFNTPNLTHCLPYWGEVVALGSGAPYLIDWLREKGDAYIAAGLSDDSVQMRARRASEVVPSQLLEEDTRQMRTLRAGVGGYYESYAIGSSSIVPDDSVLTVFGRFKRGAPSPVIEIRRIFFHVYDKDLLVVGSLTGVPLDVSVSKELVVPLASFKAFEIPPLDAPNQPLKWNSSRLAQMLGSAARLRLTTYRGANDQSVKRFFEGEQGRRLIRTRVSGESLRIKLDEEDLDYFYERTDARVPL